eukprot:m.19345 g.19345  ORF g.19345 m.19345 type:complete len:98 (-) comp8017_c0_seq3:465-758(-)
MPCHKVCNAAVSMYCSQLRREAHQPRGVLWATLGWSTTVVLAQLKESNCIRLTAGCTLLFEHHEKHTVPDLSTAMVARTNVAPSPVKALYSSSSVTS